MSNVIIDALNYYFEKKKLYQNIKSLEFHENSIVELMPTASVDGKLIKYNIIGTFTESTKTFTWAWHLNIPRRNYIKTKQLLIHSLNTASDTLLDAYTRRILTSSTINNTNGITLTTILSLATYLTKADGIAVSSVDDKDMMTFIGCYDIENN
jgi:hypothetical protein